MVLPGRWGPQATLPITGILCPGRRWHCPPPSAILAESSLDTRPWSQLDAGAAPNYLETPGHSWLPRTFAPDVVNVYFMVAYDKSRMHITISGQPLKGRHKNVL